MPVNPDDQLEFDEDVVNDAELEKALEEREKRKASRNALQAEFKEADEKAKALIAGIELEPDTTVRCGRFKITRSHVEGRSVAFETESTNRLSITADS
jgi:hypothetical protein